jgi:hypothetical protein
MSAASRPRETSLLRHGLRVRIHTARAAFVRDREAVATDVAPAWIYLDQKDWIALARLRAGKPCADGLREAASALAAHVSAGDVVTPFSESHVIETGGISNPTKRQEVATTIVVLSRRHALAPIQSLWAQEADAFLRRHFGAVVDAELEPYGKGRSDSRTPTSMRLGPWMLVRLTSRWPRRLL